MPSNRNPLPPFATQQFLTPARFPPPKRDGPVRAEGAARGGRGGRGGSRGRGEARGGARNGAPRAAAKPAQTISFDATAFPSLA